MTGYTKLFGSILDSTVWQTSKETKLVWITMLAMKDWQDIVEASVPGLAARAGVTVGECEEALRVLKAPDPYSRTKEHEGRRIEEVEGGWKVLNGNKYRARLSSEDRKAYQAAWMREWRAKKKLAAMRKGGGAGEAFFHNTALEGGISAADAVMDGGAA